MNDPRLYSVGMESEADHITLHLTRKILVRELPGLFEVIDQYLATLPAMRRIDDEKTSP